MIEAVLFDLGDTLLHAKSSKTTAILESAARPVYDRLGELDFSLPPLEVYLRVLKRHFWRVFIWSKITRREIQISKELQRIHRRLGIKLGAQQVNELCIQNMIPVVRRIFTLDADAVDVVKQLHSAGFKLGLVSNTVLPGLTVDDFLGQKGLLEYFPVRIYSSEVRYMKPVRKIFQLAVDGLAVPVQRTVFVGDRVDNDVRGPSRMGMKTILVVQGETVRRARVRPDWTVRRLSEVPAVLRDQRL